jgi:acyl transferase domain-containing protein/acyl-CoA synthetase (AMP-forming)/AMP-acid ligase II/tryptophanase/acyl carrier protein
MSDERDAIPPHVRTLVDVARHRASWAPRRTAYSFLRDGEVLDEVLTYDTLDRRARAVAVRLAEITAPGDRVLLIYPPDLSFISAFLGCLYAGVVAVPANPPRAGQTARRLQSILRDSGATLALSTASFGDKIEGRLAEIAGPSGIPLIATDTLDESTAEGWRAPPIGADTLAFLQYTSGSTGDPKGVMVSHGNLAQNLEFIRRCFRMTLESMCVNWLPGFHDMGLIGVLLTPLYVGFPSLVMPPAAFMQRPICWLRAISQYRGTICGAPNVAFDLCVRGTTPDERAALDLSSWELAFCGAEPVRRDTLERFIEAFAPSGFRRSVFYPCYGQAEATLIVTGGDIDAEPVYTSIDAAALGQNRIVEAAAGGAGEVRHLVGCGRPWLGGRVIVVDPERRTVAAPGEVGEIWTASPSVAQGYWRRPEQTEQTFRARLADTGEGPFLRTGDLGFFQGDELFITGRSKDMIIVRGSNHYPEDIEPTVFGSHPALRPHGGAAFGVEIDGEEVLVVVHEVERSALRSLDAAEVAAAARKAVANEHGLDLHAMIFLKTGALPKTSSGKVQRRACKEGFLSGTIEHVVGEWRSAPRPQAPLPPPPDEAASASPPPAAAQPRTPEATTPEAVERWLTQRLAQHLQIDPAGIDPDEPFAVYGLDSAATMRFALEIEKFIGLRVPAAEIYNHPSLRALSGYLAELASPEDEDADVLAPDEGPVEPIAIIGMSCRFPRAPDARAYWRLLREGIDAIEEMPAARWDLDAFYEPGVTMPGKMVTRWGGFLPDVDRFDPQFFNISPREAEQMDPQQRLVLMVAWEALEHAGIVPSSLAGSATGVFMGICANEYSRLLPTERALELSPYAGTGNSFAVTANRLSYFLDARGPSWSVDTACSSSLVALHSACQSLRARESDLALSGGVNALLTPETTIILSQAGMMAPDGRCKVFDASANGYVRSEGCGVVVLKRLADAQRDGDRILAVVHGSAVNQDGRSNGLTAPNGLAQLAVIRRALRSAGASPREISYVEAHGTGTALGDPIEVGALKKALGERSAEEPCWIGSAKANLGHLESAAGMAGLLKGALMLQHGEIPPQLHLEKLNPSLGIEGTPFRVADRLEPWPGPPEQRRMGVSSFGFGGTNVHVVLGPPPPSAPVEAREPSGPQIIVLSARSEVQLGHYAARLADFLEGSRRETPPPPLPREGLGTEGIGAEARLSTELSRVAWTLQASREPMRHRLAIVAHEIGEVAPKLRRFAAGPGPIEGLISGRAAADQRRSAKPRRQRSAGPEVARIQALIEQREWAELGRMWVEGTEIDWRRLHPEPRPELCDLPFYPFADERYWMPGVGRVNAAGRRDGRSAKLHPLIDCNRSTLRGVAFSVQLRGNEFFLDDHRVGGKRIFPAVAYAEMAHAAGGLAGDRRVIALRDLLWTRPLAVEVPLLELTIRLTPGGEDADYAVSHDGPGGEEVLCAEGKICFGKPHEGIAAEAPLDVDAVFARCPDRLNTEACYALFREKGLHYGLRMQGIVELAGNESEAIARVRLPEPLRDGVQDFGLHPALLDAALQAVLGLSGSREAGLHLPFSLDALELVGPMPDAGYAHVTTRESQASGIKKLDVRIVDDEGRTRVRLENLVVRAVRQASPEVTATAREPAAPAPRAKVATAAPTTAPIHYFHPCWSPRTPAAAAPERLAPAGVTMIFDVDRARFDRLRARLAPLSEGQPSPLLLALPGQAFQQISADTFAIDPASPDDHQRLLAAVKAGGQAVTSVLHLWGAAEPLYPIEDHPDWKARLGLGLERGVYTLFHLAKALVAHASGRKVHVCCAFSNRSGAPVPHLAALSSLLKTIHLEYPRAAFKLVEIEDGAGDTLDRALAELSAGDDALTPYIRYDARGCWEYRIEPIHLSATIREARAGIAPLKPRGAYLVTGGAGGLGGIFARHLAVTAQARLLLVGRSPLSDAGRARLDELARLGGEAAFVQADVSDLGQMQAAVDEARRRYGALDGVIHSAGLTRDRLFLRKPTDELTSVLLPKIDGTLVLDAVTRGEPLDFFAMFSSVTALPGNRGQADYTTGNAFMDFFAGLRESLVSRGLRRGRTLAISWPIWKEGGMAIHEEVREDVLRMTGLTPLGTAEGVESFQVALRSGLPRLMAVTGERPRIERVFSVLDTAPFPDPLAAIVAGVVEAPARAPAPVITETPVAAPPNPPTPEGGEADEALIERTQRFLATIFADTLKLRVEDVDPTRGFQEYGVDSFLVLQLIKRLQREFGSLPKTLLFEYFDLAELSRYFVREHRATLLQKFAAEGWSAPAAPAPVKAAPAAPSEPVLVRERDLPAHPELDRAVLALLRRYGLESVALARRDIAPFVFLNSDRSGCIYVHHDDRLLLGIAYLGPESSLHRTVLELSGYAGARSLSLNILSEARLDKVGDLEFTSTPFGAVQRLPELRSWSTEGGPMRRLRYLITRYQREGRCAVVEHRPGSDPAIDQAILALIDRWCAAKTMVNPYVHRVKAEIASGRLGAAHRVFLTTLDDRLQNAIVISKMPSVNGYLMDLEFYPPDMPLGGLEFCIAGVLEKLVAEGCTTFSMGATHGVRIASSPNADPGALAVLSGLQEKGIFDGAGNLQFKNKFRPENAPYYLCRPVGADPSTVPDVILMIANPDALDGGAEPAPAKAPAPPITPGHLAPADVEFDLITDSWAQLDRPGIHARIDQLRARLSEAGDAESALREVFPFAHLVLVASGRQAESFLCQAWARRGGYVPQNLLFPTFIYHQINNDLRPEEMPVPEAFDLSSASRFRGNLDCRRLAERLGEDSGGAAFVCVELCDNAAGGAPVSLQNLREVKALCARYQVPLVLDLTRVVDNALAIVEHEQGHAGRSVWDVVAEICALADAATASLSKDFAVPTGGLVATNDATLKRRLDESVTSHGSGLSAIDRRLVGLAVRDRAFVERAVAGRMRHVERLAATLAAQGLCAAPRASGHCVLLDVERLPELGGAEQPLQSFLALLHDRTGIRGGAHSAGMKKDTPLGNLVRLAVPVGMEEAEIDVIVSRLARLREAMGAPARRASAPITAPALKDEGPALGAEIPFRSLPSEPLPGEGLGWGLPEGPEAVIRRWEAQTFVGGPPEIDVAVVGMAGRYPLADDLREFWDNLAAGRDCITESPLYRWTGGKKLSPIDGFEPRRGGFVNHADKFDSLFFNISPREAESLDPQERMFLEVAWEAFEDAGYVPDALAAGGQTRNVGVFVGAVWALYQIMGAEEILAGNLQTPNSFLWSIANRLSHVMNLDGPSMAVDTACSASLTAIHLACESIRRKECQMALVGGVNLDLHPIKQLMSRASNVLSEDGKCRAFGKGANGYVPGEGAGALVLKPLHRAVRDGDNIHGVIKGTMVNHGGRAGGYMVPNPNAQADLVHAAIRRSGVDGRTIGYVEAHGTGTQLGDPIEIAGLNGAFRRFNAPRGSCPVGSVKTNIGHLEAAAGIAGVTKVLLGMRHGMLVPSLHSSDLNELIDFEESPFYVQQSLCEWPPALLDGVRHPRRAGISSFGAGGANGHVVVEEFAPTPADDVPGAELIVLSARSEEQLLAYAAKLERFIARDLAGDDGLRRARLRDIAYTLQVGRKPLEVRLALLVSSKQELRERLSSFVSGGKTPDTLVTGDIRQNRALATLFHARETEPLVRSVADSGDLLRLGQLWAGGVFHAFGELGERRKGRRISLPTYPFARQRHWIPAAQPANGVHTGVRGPALHPLLDVNESTFERQSFRKKIDTSYFVFRDHIVAGLPTLPGVAYLEIARAAAELSAGRTVRTLKNLVWASPINSRSQGDIRVDLSPRHDEVDYEVTTGAGDERVVHAQGKLRYASSDPEAPPPPVDLQAILARCPDFKSGELLYDMLRQCHLTYGTCLQAISGLHHNREEGVTVLKLPAPLEESFGDFVIHPSLMDGAVQSIIGLLLDADVERNTPYLPFVLGEVVVYRPLTPVCYAHLRLKSGKESLRSMKKLDVDILDPEGRRLVSMKDFSLKALSLDAFVEGAPGPRAARMYYRNVWVAS